ncbi:mitochondrial substrate carrier family protein B-like isoform X2 [Phoenix dactylifera]|nr:mitochondrial substrate carrier family protein B-like isoform X2 [Phoenix dactylifera]
MYYRGISHALYAICRDEGISGLYKGLGGTLLQSASLSMKPCDLIGNYKGHMILLYLLAGLVEVFSAWLRQQLYFPLDLVRRQMQLPGAAGEACVRNSGLFGTFRHLIHMEGFRELYRDILPEH